MSIFVFLGPSLPREEARLLLDAVYLPPVSMGDLYVLVSTRARPGDHIAIVDGLFERVPSVWHKEILYALSRGMHVYGAASMGALRAAELHTFGMRGIGRIFEAFRTLTLDSDDEVAVSHADASNGYRSLSTALVSIRFGIEEMAHSGVVSPSLAKQLIEAVAALPYPRRSWAAVLSAAIEMQAPQAFIDRIRHQAALPDAKARDAAELLSLLREEAEQNSKPYEPSFTFQNTSYWLALVQEMALRVETECFTAQSDDAFERNAIANFVRAGGEGRDQLMQGALLDRLAVEFARSFAPDRKDLREAERRIAHRNGIPNVAAMKVWRGEQCISDAEWQHILEADSRREWLRRTLASDFDRFLIARLKADGRYSKIRKSRQIAYNQIDRRSMGKPSLADFGLTPDILQRWYAERFGPMIPDPASHAQSLHFSTLRDFIDALLECYLANTGGSPSTAEPLPELQPRIEHIDANVTVK